MSFRAAILLPTYNETESLKRLLEELVVVFKNEVIYIVVDDSEDSRSTHVSENFFSDRQDLTYHVIESKVKRGRGDAILRGIKFSHSQFGVTRIIEMDSDGSHSVLDASNILKELENGSQFVIGSRYLPESEISGWPKSRLMFSKILNKTLSKIFPLKISDWTNGLRGYSEESSLVLVSEGQIVTGFTYLSEQILVLNKFGIYPREIPSKFRNRVHGSSSVGFKELKTSFIGIFKLLREHH
jgi:dolichol-phosphate mannosyltransferase